MKITIFLLTLLLCCITLISCGNSETGGGETSALSPIDTTVTIPETVDDTTSPKQTTLSPETTSTPETTVLQEPPPTKTPEVTETTHTEETAAPSYNFFIGFNNSQEITGTFKVHSAKCRGDGDSNKIIRNKEQLDNFNWGTSDMYATTPAFPVSLNDTLKQFDESFFENNYLVIGQYHNLICYTTDEVLYASKVENRNELYFYYNLKKVQEEPENTQNYSTSWNWWYVFVEIPKELCNENTTTTLIPAHLIHFYYDKAPMGSVSLYYPLKYISYYEPSMEDRINQTDISVFPDSFFEALFQSEDFKKYLLIQRNIQVQLTRNEDEVAVRAIDELLKHCK